MPRPDLEQLFLAHLPAAEKILGALARRHRLSPDAADDFSGWAKLRIIENDYAILAKFRGESLLTSYLNVVISMLYREYRVQEWGRWRPSAAARKAGNVAVQLEILTQRDGVPLAQAGQMLRSSGVTNLPDRELAKIMLLFPMRAPLRPVQTGEPPADAAGALNADGLVSQEEARNEADRANKALDAALKAIPDEDRLIVRMHFLDGMSVADIARGLALPQKPLYRRLERALASLKAILERAGISREWLRGLDGDAA